VFRSDMNFAPWISLRDISKRMRGGGGSGGITGVKGCGIGGCVGVNRFILIHREAGPIGREQGAVDLLPAAQPDAGLVQPPNIGPGGGHPRILGECYVP
jgi:hypothetical protein